MTNTSVIVNYFVNAILFSLPALMVGYRLEKRPYYWARVVLCVGFLMLYLGATPATRTVYGTTGEVFLTMTLYFAGVVVVLVGEVLFAHRTSVWAASFCAVVGYTVQNIGSGVGELVGQILRRYALHPVIMGNSFYRSIVCCAIAYVVFYYVVIHDMHQRALVVDPNKQSLLLVFGVVLINIVFDLCVKYIRAYSVPSFFTIVFRVVQLLICLYTLVIEFEMLLNRHLEAVAATTERMMIDREQQYEASRENIEAINIKVHDIKHQIRHLGDVAAVDGAAIADIAREVSIYDSTAKTGNEALDTILTEKGLVGEREGITLSCIADGSALAFMRPADIYSLFGNAIDNAFEAVRQLDDPEKRNISLLVKRVAGMASVHVENYYEGTVRFVGGLPQTTKADATAHGFGTRSMQALVEGYGGTIAMDAQGGTFALDMLIPIPKE